MVRDPAEFILEYLALRSSAQPVQNDAIVGFGHFDLRIARRCGQLWRAGAAPRILFTGGFGAGSGHLDRPEAEAFAQELRTHFPEIPDDAVLIESRSTHTGENVRFLSTRAAAAHWPLRTVALVASPYRQRRVSLTWRRHMPGSAHFNCPPPTTLEHEIELFRAQGQDFVDLLPAEIDRLTDYAARGWIAAEPIPLAVAEAAERLRRR